VFKLQIQIHKIVDSNIRKKLVVRYEVYVIDQSQCESQYVQFEKRNLEAGGRW
jgi:hypothetical protein